MDCFGREPPGDVPLHTSWRVIVSSPRILLIKPSSLGDIVHTLPVVAALKQRWPAAHLTWLVKRQWADLVERAEGVDDVRPLEASVGSWLSEARALRRKRWDLVIDLQGLFRSAVMGWLSGGPVRIGFVNAREGSPWFYSQRVPVPSLDMHAVDRYLLAAAAAGAPLQGPPQFRFKMPETDLSVVRAVFQRNGISLDTSWVAMHVSARWPTKRWPLRSFAAVADQLARDGHGPIVVMGSPDEARDVEQLKSLTATTIVNLAGAIPLGCLPTLLSNAAVMVTNDSGPMHVAAAVGTPVVALFGPTSA